MSNYLRSSLNSIRYIFMGKKNAGGFYAVRHGRKVGIFPTWYVVVSKVILSSLTMQPCAYI